MEGRPKAHWSAHGGDVRPNAKGMRPGDCLTGPDLEGCSRRSPQEGRVDRDVNPVAMTTADETIARVPIPAKDAALGRSPDAGRQ
jgi:hypothetical protein